MIDLCRRVTQADVDSADVPVGQHRKPFSRQSLIAGPNDEKGFAALTSN
ncbi:MAG: hypothetical protein P8N76_22780 [Pirellulaceae bacterium]|nr:hypothetical protein [Pirellulaceae bacterium]